MDHLGAELGELGADIGLRDQQPCADDADAFEWPECRNDARGVAGRSRCLIQSGIDCFSVSIASSD